MKISVSFMFLMITYISWLRSENLTQKLKFVENKMFKSDLCKEPHQERDCSSLFRLTHCYSRTFLWKRKVVELAMLSVEKAVKF